MKIFDTHFINHQKLPLVIEPVNKGLPLEKLISHLNEAKSSFQDLLLKHGGLLLRNFPVKNIDDFTAVIESFDLGEFVNYIGGGSPRTKVKKSVYTSTEAPPGIKIPLHNEMSFVKNFPKHIYFYCETPPETGGETFIGDARKIYNDMNEEVKRHFHEKGLKYISRYYYKSQFMDLMNKIQRGHKTWIDVFETDSKKEVERKCQENEFGYKWFKNDWLQIERNRPSTYEHPITKEKVWFNQAHLFDYNPRFIGWGRYIAMKAFYCRKNSMIDEIFYGDDSKIERKDIYQVMDVLDKNSIYFPWQKGDIMVLDNVLTMHGRASFSGKRRILTAMTK